MMVTWVLEKDVFSEKCFTEMVKHFKAKSIPYHIVRVIPFIHEIDGKVPQIEGPVVVYGSIGVQKLAKRHGWEPGIWLCPDELTLQLSPLHRYLLNWPAIFMSIKQVQDWIDKPQSSYDASLESFFIKPDEDSKEFAGHVINRNEFKNWYAGMISSGYLDDKDFNVLISKPKELGCEWRAVVVDGKIASCSLYRQYQQVMPERHILPEVEALIHEAHEAAAYFTRDTMFPAILPPVYVVDVCQRLSPDAAGNVYKIVEYNTFNSAGLYDCDVAKIIDNINEFVERQACLA